MRTPTPSHQAGKRAAGADEMVKADKVDVDTQEQVIRGEA